MAISVRNILREGTQQHHRKIESQMNLTDTSINQAQYVAVIERLAGYYQPLEELIGASKFLPTDLNWDKRRKTPLLLEDLRTLAPGSKFAIAPRESYPCIDSKAELLGILYVLEGSTLGGQLLSKHFAKILELRSENGARFFNGYGTDTGPMWMKFIGLLEREITSEDDAAAALQAARRTFSSLGEWMSA